MIRVCLDRKHRIWVYLTLAIAVCLLVVLPARAQEVLQTTLTNMQESEQWWDKLWKDTFDPSPTDLGTSISIYTFATAVRFILAIGGIFGCSSMGRKWLSLGECLKFSLPIPSFLYR